MTRLRQLQDDFQAFLLRPDARMDRQVTGTARVGARERLDVYANAYRLRLLEALDTDFPGLHTLVGDEEFDRLGRAYIDAFPSQHFSLRWYGHRLAEFLRTHSAYAPHEVLAEMAAFEWSVSLAFDAANSPTVTFDDLATLPPHAWPGMRFQPHASVQRLDLRWNVPAIWKAVRAEEEPEAPAQQDYPQGWVIWRQDIDTYFRSVSVDEAWAIDGLLAGQSFAELCEGLCEWIDPAHAAAHAAGMLKRWVQDGMIRNFTVNAA
jgi:hypothetical protein